MRILILDDSPNRHAWFRQHGSLNRKPATHVLTIAECIGAMAGGPWDHVYLNTAPAVTDWIHAERPKVGRFTVHSTDGSTADAMVETLRDAGYTVDRVPYTLMFMTGVM